MKKWMRFPKGSQLEWMKNHVGHSDTVNCLRWPFAIRKDGRASYHTTSGALRRMCELVHGPAPSSKHHAAHSCGKGHEGCINPNHLRWATPAENNADSLLHGVFPRYENHVHAKLKNTDVQKIFEMKESGVKQYRIAEEFGVAGSCISRILKGRRWKGFLI